MPRWSGVLVLAPLVAASASCRTAHPSPGVTIVQPGAPGEPSHVVSPAEATDLRRITYTPADVEFIQGMIGHHAQAVEMVALIADRTRHDDVRLLGRRIAASQVDEINFMQHWLEARRLDVPSEHAHHMPGATLMPGMLTADEMDRLTASTGDEFDRRFLEGMIKHHGGAVTMVEQLFATAGAAQEVDIFSFASDVEADQKIEIGRMGAMLAALGKESHP